MRQPTNAITGILAKTDLSRDPRPPLRALANQTFAPWEVPVANGGKEAARRRRGPLPAFRGFVTPVDLPGFITNRDVSPCQMPLSIGDLSTFAISTTEYSIFLEAKNLDGPA